jgi:hypothetical protein
MENIKLTSLADKVIIECNEIWAPGIFTQKDHELYRHPYTAASC